jgi:hypothetical protein
MSKMPFLRNAVLIVSICTAMPGQAQQSAIPNFTSTNFGWLVSSGFDFLPVEGKIAPVGPDRQWRGGIGQPANDFNYQPPEAAADPHRQGPSRIGPWNIERLSDAENPNLKPSAAAEMRVHNELVSHGRRAFSAMSRCWPGGPAQLLFNAEPIYFIQRPQEVWILWQRDHLVRRVYLNREHSTNPKPSWFGESVGHYEGDELVIDTVGLNDKTFVDNYQTPHTEQIHVVERFKLVEDGKILQATVTVDDPGAFKMPWSAMQRYKRGEVRPMTELSCAENNYDFLGYEVIPIPEAKSPDF